MEKKQYQIPVLTVVALQQQAALMQNSGVQEDQNSFINHDEFG